MSVDPVSLAITIALNAAAMALTASQKIKGPRLKDLSASVADYGTPLNYAYGVRRLTCPCFYCEPIKEKKQHTKTKGGKYTEYKYYGSFAILVLDSPLIYYRRIWFDKQLVFDGVGNSTEKVVDLGDEDTLIEHMRFYYGGSDQPPDPRMVLSIEAKEGPGTCPSYLDISYIMFEALPLEFLGNRFPQADVEFDAGVAEMGVPEDFSKLEDTHSGTDAAAYASDIYHVSPNGKYAVGSPITQTMWVADLENQQLVWKRNLDGYTYGDDYESFRCFAIDDEGSCWGLDAFANTGGLGALIEIPLSGDHTPLIRYYWADQAGVLEGPAGSSVYTFTMPDHRIMILLVSGDGTNYDQYSNYFIAFKGVAGLVEYETAGGFTPNWAFQDDNGDVWLAGTTRVVGGPQYGMFLERITDVTGASPYIPFNEIAMPPVDTTLGNPALVNLMRPVGCFRNGAFVGGWQGWPNTEYDTGTHAGFGETHWLFSVNLTTGVSTFADIQGAPVYFSAQQYPANPTHIFVRKVEFTPGGLTGDMFTPGYALSRIFFELLPNLTFGLFFNLDMWFAGDKSLSLLYPNTVYTSIYSDSIEAFVGVQCATFLNQNDASLFTYYLPFSQVTLGMICSDVMRRAGAARVDYDFRMLDQLIYGYSWTVGQGRDIVAYLLDIYDSDIFNHGFQLQGRKRGGTEDSYPIDSAWLVRRNGNPDSTSAPLFEITMEAESDLPRRVFATYADSTAEQQPNTAVAQRNLNSTVTTRELPLDLSTLAMSPDEAQPLAERWLRRQYIGSTTYKFTACPREMLLECADVREATLDGTFLRGRLTDMTIRADRSIDCEWTVDAAVATALKASPGAVQLGRPTPTVFNPEPSLAFIMDIPLIADSDDQTTPFAYVGASRDTSEGTFPGADIDQSDTGAEDTYTLAWDSVDSSSEITWGRCLNTLGDALPWIPDRRNVLVVDIPNGLALEGATDAELNADPTLNLAAIGDFDTGWEIVQFGDALVQSAGVWEVSNFYKRGARGTEALISLHTTDDKFVLLSRLKVHDLGASEIGDTDYYRATTNVTTPDSTNAISVLFNAQAHRPLSVVYPSITRDSGSGDWSGSWTRRTRIGGGSVNGQDVPLGESGEQYRVKVMNGLSIVRTITVTSAAFAYTNAQQVADFGSPQTSLTVKICQMDPTLSIEGAAVTVSA